MFGRMEAYKGLEILLDAVDLLNARQTAFTLILAGDGPELSRLGERIAATRGVETRREFLTPAAAIAELQRAQIVVLPYTDATQSGVASAAFANARPVVASRAGGLIDVVRDGVDGILVPPGDARALADAIESMLAEAEKFRAGAETAAAPLAWSRIAAQLLDAWNFRGQGRMLSDGVPHG